MKKILILLAFAVLSCIPASAQISPVPNPSGGSSVVSCVGSPGNTTGAYLSQCQTASGALYACKNAAGCTVAADWALVGSSIPATNDILVGSGSANVASDSSTKILYSAINSDLLLGVGFSTTLTGQADTVFGINAGSSLTAPSTNPQNNTFIGYLAGNSATTARESTIIGANAGQSIIGNGVGDEDCIDTFIGSYAGMSELCNLPASADGYDVYIGQKAGISSTHGLNNVFLGVHTGTSCFGAGCTNDVIIGQAAMNGAISNSPGIALTQSVIIGGGAFNGNTTGGTNAGDNFIGQFSGSLAYNVSNSNCFGLYSCASLASGSGITAFGDHVAQNTTVGGGSFFGANTGSDVTTGTNLSLFGNSVGTNITTGSDDSCFGNGACYYLATANQASVFGSGAGHIMTAQNDIFGYIAGAAITSGSNNVAVGSQSLHANVTSKGNTAVGYEAAHGTTAQGSTSIGYVAGYNATSGAENTFIGYEAGYGVTTGQQNVIVGGDHAPSNPLTTGSNNEALGWGAFLGAAVSGAAQIGLGTNGTSNTLQYQSINFLTNAGVESVPSAVGVSVATQVVPTPGAPTVTTSGTAGSTTDTYLLVGRAVNSTGYYSAAGSQQSITTANATLNTSNFNVITFPAPVAGISCYDVYRTAAGGTPSTTGKIASCQTVSYSDTGAAGDSTTAPTVATGGVLSLASAQTTVNCSTSGTAIFTQTHVGASLKVVEIYESACLGTASFTYPTAFSHTPQVLSQSLVSTVTSISTSSVTVTGATSTGFIKLDGF